MPVASDWLSWGTGINKTYVVALQKEMKLPGLVSNGLLGVSRSMQSVCNRAATIYEMRSPTAFQTVGLHEEEREVMSEKRF